MGKFGTQFRRTIIEGKTINKQFQMKEYEEVDNILSACKREMSAGE
jgi:hypothetical protein